MEALTLRDVADLLFAARERIDFYWNFYVVVVIAVIGWLITKKRPLTLSVKLLVSTAFAIAATTNFMGLYGSYTLAEALRIDLLQLATETPLRETRLVLEEHSYLAHRWAALWAHLGIGVAILAAVWFTTITERPKGKKGESNGT